MYKPSFLLEMGRGSRAEHTSNMTAPPPRTMAEMWTTVASMIASFMFFRAIIRQYLPSHLLGYLEKFTDRIVSYFDPYIHISIFEYTSTQIKHNEIYDAVEAYLSENSSKSAKRLKAESGKESKKIAISMDENETTTDEFQGVKVWWASGKFSSSPQRSTEYHHYTPPERRYYKLTFHRKYRDMISESYLEYVMKKGKELKVKNRQRKLYTNGTRSSMWNHVPLVLPATFHTMAMETEKKQEIMEDLLAFSQSKDFYAEIGKAWKRGYLLYGPPGTGKTTMIAAMANLLNYDVYDLELTAVRDNTDLRRLLIETTSKSIIVMEDIDCSLDLTGQRKKAEKSSDDKDEQGKKEVSKKEKDDRPSKVTLSGLLNFIDGLWSASGEEKIIVFTTNHVEKLDPALIRRGRMDMHIELPYCSFEGFKVLAKNYLKIEEHPMFETIERLMEETKITPADVAENLMPKSLKDDACKSLSNLIQALEDAKRKASTKKDEVELEVKELENGHALMQDKQETEKQL